MLGADDMRKPRGGIDRLSQVGLGNYYYSLREAAVRTFPRVVRLFTCHTSAATRCLNWNKNNDREPSASLQLNHQTWYTKLVQLPRCGEHTLFFGDAGGLDPVGN